MLFVDGNHENFERLNFEFPVEEWNGGRVHRISDNVRHLIRGEVFDIDGVSVFAFGGAQSRDKEWRTPYRSWWPEEMPSEEDFANADKNLNACGRKVDLVITHCAPSSAQYRLNREFRPDRATEFLQYVCDTIGFEHWFFGHYHTDLELPDGFRAVYQDVVRLA